MAVDKSERRVRAMFASIAGRYDLLNHVLSAGIDRYWRWRTVRAATESIDGPILDVCTGTGDLALALRKRFDDGRMIVGSDFTHEMLVLARRKVDRLRGTGRSISFVEADAQSLPFADDSFGLVCVAFGLRNVTDTYRGLAEMVRVCRSGGEVFVLEFSRPNLPVLGPVYGWYFRNVLPRVGRLFARNSGSAYQYLPESVSEFPDGPRLAELLERAGLIDVRFTRLTFGVATLYRGCKPAADAESLPRAYRRLVEATP